MAERVEAPPPSPQDLVLRFLASIGRPLEAEQYLALFRSEHPERFAIVHVADAVVRHAADARGSVLLDDGAVRAVTGSRRSLLLAGVTGVEGLFHFGDVVELHG